VKTNEGELFKQRVTRYYDAQGRRVPAGTTGATKEVIETKRWYARLKDPTTGKWRLYCFSKDKQASRLALADLEKKLAMREAGLADPYEEAKNAPIKEHVQAYLDDLAELGRSKRYRLETKREIDKVVAASHAERLHDLTADKVDDYLKSLTCSARTKNAFRQAVIGLCNFLVRKRKLPYNPLLITTRRKGEVKRKRRALPAPALQALLDAARQRPLLEGLTIRNGPRKGQLLAQVSAAERARLQRIGRHRALLYLTAIHTGLRLGTLRRLKVAYLTLGFNRPWLDIPGSIMKSRRDYKWPLHPALAEELRKWVAEEGKKGDDLVFDIPPHSQTSKLLKKDLKKAGIPHRDALGRVFDFHSFRKCTGSFLRQAKVDPSVSMQYLDHSDIRMTMEVYNDESLLDAEGALQAIPQLTIGEPATPDPQSTPLADRVPLLHPGVTAGASAAAGGSSLVSPLTPLSKN
jgi:integrase